MAVYTDVSDEALARFLAAYDVGEATAFKGIAEGVENSNYLLDTTGPDGEGARYILTLYEQRVAASDLPFFVGLMDHLAARGFACPQPVRRRDGDALGELQGRPAAMVTFLQGTWSTQPDESRMRQVGETAARMHLLAADFATPRKNALDRDGWPPLAERAGARADEVEPGLAALIPDELAWLDGNMPSGLPWGTVHADLFPDNVFFLGERLSGVIDFYFACNEQLAWELAVAINAWCFDAANNFLPGHAAALLEGYDAVRALEPAEREALPVLCRGAALRFLLTRTVDWLNVPPGALVRPHDPKVFSARLRHFRTAMGAAS